MGDSDMTDAAIATTERAVPVAGELQHRPAMPADLGHVVAQLHAVIDESPHYNDAFKAFEKRRLNRGYLEALTEADPWHVMLITYEGKVAGGMISGPEFGSVFRYWSWVSPRYRDTRVAMYGMRMFDQVFDNGRFHKAFTFVRPENEVAMVTLRRYGYKQAALLQQHLFGMDFVLMEKPYTKRVEGYDCGIRLGKLAAARRWLKRLIARP